MRHCDSELHVTGRSTFLDDLPAPSGMLHAAVLGSPLAHATIRHLDYSRAMQAPGVRSVFSFNDVPGDGFIGPLIQDEPIFAHESVVYEGQPIALVVARSPAEAREAVQLIEVDLDPLPIIINPREAFRRGEVLQPTREFTMGDVETAWARCDIVVEGSTRIGGQEHLYLETNRARAVPAEDGQIRIFSSTQSPTSVQKAVAMLLGIPMNKVEVDVRRIGGGFGGKEDQATHWSCMVALAAYHIGKPVQLILSRTEDMKMTGKRHPYEQDFKIGLTRDEKILAYQVDHYQNAGAFMDLSAAVLERSVLHSTNAYAIPNVRIRGTCCRTNLPPNTAFRGFGAPQAMFALEAAIFKAAGELRVAPESIQARNIISENYTFHYGQRPKACAMARTWQVASEQFDIPGARLRTQNHNVSSPGIKKGFAVMPVCFGISFTRACLNQGSSLVHIYIDGSVGLSTGAVEMGQGVSSNMIAVTARSLGIRSNRIRLNSTNTSRIANTSATAASISTDLNGGATILACEQILKGLTETAARILAAEPKLITIQDETVHVDGEPTDLHWEALVQQTYTARVPLMAHGFFAPTGLHFDHLQGKGHPFQYYSCGTCLIEVTVDCLRGTYTIDAIKVAQDLGRSIIPDVDLGQIEGGVAQGIGWVTLEDLSYSDRGHLDSHALSTYKAPDASFIPDHIDVHFLESPPTAAGVHGSKAVGEPPFMYGIAAYFAIQQAIDAYREQQDGKTPTLEQPFVSPMTPERVLLRLHPDFRQNSDPRIDRPRPTSGAVDGIN